ncbi:MAG: hypothetical protein NUW02_02245 [Candidatus Campbellbacteria bacterium]|nr:hypothetical protein [Candidatus Campbellbacteria bacterium]
MKKIFYIVIGLVILSGVSYVIFSSRTQEPITPEDENQNTDDGRVRAPAEVALGVGKTGEGAGLSLTLNKVVSDSRCPTDVQCIWAGAVTVDVTLQSGTEKTTVTMVENEQPVTFAGYRVSLLSVTPTPKSTISINPQEYVVTFYIAPILGINPLPENM